MRAIIFEVKPQGSRVKVVLSRTRPQLVQRLFEQEIPEIADGVITINAIAREPGHRSKVAVSSSDQRVDCVGACVGVRGNRIKNIVDELAGERIDIVRYSDDAETLIRAALQPAEVDQVLLCDMIGRAIVLVREDQLSLAIGRKGQNVRLASKLCGWDIEIMTNEELEEQIDRAVARLLADRGDDRRAGPAAGRAGLSVVRRSVGDRARCPDGNGRPDRGAGRSHRRPGRGAGRSKAEKAADEEKRRKKEEDAAAAAAAASGAAAPTVAPTAASTVASPPAAAPAPPATVAPPAAPSSSPASPAAPADGPPAAGTEQAP